jgi:hypothetical protein
MIGTDYLLDALLWKECGDFSLVHEDIHQRASAFGVATPVVAPND